MSTGAYLRANGQPRPPPRLDVHDHHRMMRQTSVSPSLRVGIGSALHPHFALDSSRSWSAHCTTISGADPPQSVAAWQVRRRRRGLVALFGTATVVSCVLLFGLPLGRRLGTGFRRCFPISARRCWPIWSTGPGSAFRSAVPHSDPPGGGRSRVGKPALPIPVAAGAAGDECALYLGALTSAPVPVPDGPIAILAVSPSPWVAVFSLFALTAVGLALGTWRLRRLEVRHTED